MVNDNRNITLSLPLSLLKRVKLLAAERDSSISSLTNQAQERFTHEDRRYAAVRGLSLEALRSSRSLGTGGQRTWSRDELHER